jgi:integrase
MFELLSPALEALKDQNQYTYDLKADVFHNPQTNLPWKHDGPLRKTAWKPALETAGVPYRKPYSTRHTYASLMLSNGVNPMLVAKQMGHKDWGMLRKVYGRWLPDTDTTISDKVSFLWTQNGHKDITSV